jgi:tRNA (guanosine-2'-O-)-methyltransferase
MNETDRLVLTHLSQFVSEHKKEFISRVLDARTRHITVVLEDIFQSQNASAVVRTCECMGVQDVHIVEQLTKYSINPRVLKGANKWMNLYRYQEKETNNTQACFDALRVQGYRVLVADPSQEGVPIHEVDVQQKIALVFGNELRGVSKEALTLADQRIKIPMYGFTESLNISVSVAICLNTLITKLHQSASELFLPETEKDIIRLNWFRKIVRRSDLIEKEFLRTIQ